MAKVVWEEADQEGAVYGTESLCRANVPGGWLVRLFRGHGSEMRIIFVPDQNHEWKSQLDGHLRKKSCHW